MKKKILSVLMILVLAVTALSGCGKKENTEPNAGTNDNTPAVTAEASKPENQGAAAGTPEVTGTPAVTEAPVAEPAEDLMAPYRTQPETENFIELAINVYYNDADSAHYANEPGTESLFITDNGTYTLTYDCDRDLSEEAKGKGVRSLTNLTAIYILDMGSTKGAQSPLKAADILFEKVVVDGTELTVTQTAAKSAFKSSGVFDTNDPVNAWDGSQVAEVAAGSDHVANFTTVKNPKTIAVTFTLSNMNWTGEEAVVEALENNEVVAGFVNDYKVSELDLASMDAITLTKYMGNGINLGNTMEAYGHSTLGYQAKPSTYETYWGQPITTAEMVLGMKNSGFDTLRIPVSWTNMMNYEAGDYTIAPAYLDRVQEIVDYAIAAEMFVIVNDHWDGGWWGMFGSKTPETVETAWTLYTEMWKQIAERFKDYPDMLIFESANEELGNSLNDNTRCADSGALSESGKYEMTNAINQKFVDIIRSSGGNNDDRFLLIAGFNTDIDKTCDSRYQMPRDTVKGKLLLSVHYYTPWNYCGAEKEARWGIQSEYKDMVSYLSKMQKYTDMGYGVIIGEYGALPVYNTATGHTLKSNTEEYHSYFLDLCDTYNYCPVLWSCNDFYKRLQCTMMDEMLLNLYTGRCFMVENEMGEAAYAAQVKEHMEAAETAAPAMWEDVVAYAPGTPVAWIMWNGGAGTYSVGDTYNPADNTAGIKATTAIVEGAGKYTVALDFAGGNTGLTFAALAIADGELLWPNSVIKILGIYIDGEKYSIPGQCYTNSDDGKCMRVNLYNQWVTKLPSDARTASGSLTGATQTPLDPTALVNIKNITIEFELIVK